MRSKVKSRSVASASDGQSRRWDGSRRWLFRVHVPDVETGRRRALMGGLDTAITSDGLVLLETTGSRGWGLSDDVPGTRAVRVP